MFDNLFAFWGTSGLEAVIAIPFFTSWATLLGLVLGSFYAACAVRYRAGQKITGHSHCPTCNTPLRAAHLVPVLSWLFLRGRCAFCHSQISPLYPVVETLSGGTAALLAVTYGPSPAFASLLILTGILITAATIDFCCLILPDRLTLPGAALALVCAVGVLGLSWQNALGGGLGGAGLFWLLRVLFKHWRGVEGLGMGDVKLMLMLGFLSGAQHLAVLLLLSSLSALVVSGAVGLYGLCNASYHASLLTQRIPFGPFLSAGGFITVLYGTRLAV